MAENIKKVSKKKILFVQLDEEITSVFERLEKLPYPEVYVVVPRRAALLQSVVNLKILKQKLQEIGKTMAIITSDPSGMKLAYQAEIKVYDQWDLSPSLPLAKQEKGAESALLKPIAAAQNEVGDESPFRLPKKKSSIFEIVRQQKGKGKGFSLRAYLADLKKNRLEQKPMSLYLTPGKKRWIFGLLLASALIFFVIAYVALPGATIAIEPASTVVTKAVNVILEPNPKEAHSLKVYEVETEVDYTLNHSATGVISEGQNASGKLTVLNLTGVARPLITQTRFQTEDGIVFRIQEEVIVSAGTVANPGTLEVTVVADSLDAYGVPVGERGNIEPSRFFLPGLREDSREELYGESYEAMSGGTTVVRTKVTEEDLSAARTKLENDLKEKALAALRKETLSVATREGIDLKLVEDSDVIQYASPLIDIPYELVGQEMESFEISGSLGISGVAYDKETLYSILRTEIISTKTPGKQLVSVDPDSVSILILESDPVEQTYKMTASIQGIEEYEIDPELEGGSQVAEKIKEHIAGKSIEEAKNYIQNLPEVNSVEISVWPLWSPAIPTLPENIKIKSLSESEVVTVNSP